MPGKLADCICSFSELLGGAKSEVVALLDSLIVSLTVLKTYLELYSVNFVDQAKKLGYEAELQVVQTTIDTLEAPFNMVLGYTKLMSDCDPVNSLAALIKAARDTVLTPAKEVQFELDQLIAAIDDNRKEIATIERWIETLQDVKESLDLCGT